MIYIQNTNGLTSVGMPPLKTINGQSLIGRGDLLLNLGGAGLSEAFGRALLDCLAHVAWTDNNGAHYYNALYQALYPVDSISIVFDQGDLIIYDDSDLSVLKSNLVVTAHCNGQSLIVDANEYNLSGLLIADSECQITVEYFGFTEVFTVRVERNLLPAGYTKYDYIQKKADTKGSTIAQTSFIWLPALENINTLSFEGVFGQKPGTTNGTTGVFGARPSTGLGYAFYWNGTADDPAYVYLRGTKINIPSIKDVDKIKLTIDNPTEGPYVVKIDDEVVGTGNWTSENDVDITRQISLFNNIPEGNSEKMYIHWTVRIGEMKFTNANGECVAHFVPCTNSANKIGMYDVIGQQFHTASTASAVTVGNSGVLYTVGKW